MVRAKRMRATRGRSVTVTQVTAREGGRVVTGAMASPAQLIKEAGKYLKK